MFLKGNFFLIHFHQIKLSWDATILTFKIWLLGWTFQKMGDCSFVEEAFALWAISFSKQVTLDIFSSYLLVAKKIILNFIECSYFWTYFFFCKKFKTRLNCCPTFVFFQLTQERFSLDCCTLFLKTDGSKKIRRTNIMKYFLNHEAGTKICHYLFADTLTLNKRNM